MKYCLLLLLAFAGIVTADVPLPATPAGRVLGEWLEQFNSGDAAVVKAFNERHRRTTNSVEDTLASRAASGGFAVLRIQLSEPLKIVALVQEKDTERPFRLELTATAEDPPVLDKISATRGELPADLAPPRMSQPEALRALTTRINQLVEQDRFSGVVLIARHDKVLLEEGWGRANRETGAPVTTETQFRVGSQNKMFTAVAMLQLIEAGKASLQDPIGKYLVDYPNQELARKVTIRHLLTHTGGTGDFFGPEFQAQRLSLKEHSDYLKLFGARPVEFEPGSADRYSNYGFLLLGALIEKISGQSYDDQVRQRIYEPAGMRSTAALPESDNVPRRAAGYTKGSVGGWKTNADTLLYRGTAAGGGYSTAADLLRFAQALQSGRLLSKEMFATATAPQNLAGHYGYGFGVYGSDQTHYYGHGGGAPGMNAELRVYPKLGYVLVALSNLDPPAASMLVDYYAARMPLQ